MGDRASRLKRFLLSTLAVWAYFAAAGYLLRLTQNLVLAQHGLRGPDHSVVLIGALLVAKVYEVVDHLRFVDRFDERPLAVGILWKTMLFFAGCIAFQIAEHTARLLIHGGNLAGSFAASLRHIGSMRMLLIQLWLLFFLLVLTTAREFARSIGSDNVKQMLFGSFGRAQVLQNSPATGSKRRRSA